MIDNLLKDLYRVKKPQVDFQNALNQFQGIKKPHRYRPPETTGQSMLKMNYSNSLCNMRTTGLNISYEEPEIDQYKSYINFLKYGGIVKANLIPDKNGNVSFAVPVGKYTNLIAIASDQENIVQVGINVRSYAKEIQKSQLTLTKPLDPKKNFNEVRKVLNFKSTEKHKIKDLTSADYTIIDTLEKVKNIQLEIAKTDHNLICPDLFFLVSWHKLSYEEKIKKYTLYVSHETHLFLYFKDKQFFDKVVKPFIINKVEKSFIDYWLLEDYAKIENYTRVEFDEMLNSVEKIIMIYTVRQYDENTSKLLLERMKMNVESIQENLEYRNM